MSSGQWVPVSKHQNHKKEKGKENEGKEERSEREREEEEKNRKERKGNADLDTDIWKRPCGWRTLELKHLETPLVSNLTHTM